MTKLFHLIQVLVGSEMMYAVGQGALAVECVGDDLKTVQLLSVLHHRETALQVVAERSFLCSLGGGCSAPVGVVSEISNEGSTLVLEGGVWSLDGVKKLIKKLSCNLEKSLEEPPRLASVTISFQEFISQNIFFFLSLNI